MESVAISRRLSKRMSNMAFVCSLLVVAMHTISISPEPILRGSSMWWFDALFRSVFTPIAVPYFFCSAGYFLMGHINEDGWWYRAVCKRVRTLLIPYVIWIALAFFIKRGGYVALNILNGRSWNFGIDVGILTILQAIGLTFESPDPTAYWFIRALFLYVLVSPIIVAALSRGGGGLL